MTYDSFNDDRSGWANFSDDDRMRYRLGRKIKYPFCRDCADRDGTCDDGHPCDMPDRCVVFVMLNPSTADAFVLDPTVRKCIEYARQDRASSIEVVNVFALRSTDPKELYKYAHGSRGDDATNDAAILAACNSAYRIICAWGKHGALGGRAASVRKLLGDRELHYLKLNKDGSPSHPLYLKATTPFEVWK